MTGDTFIVLDGSYFPETEQGYSRAACIKDILEGQYRDPRAVYIIHGNGEQPEDVSAEIAEACLDRIIAAYWPGHDPYIPEIIEEYCTPGLNDWQSEMQEAVGG